ncbi:MAG: hypothetical protein ACRD4Q_15415, partial [Candidatus Acidiferrales bacterium]
LMRSALDPEAVLFAANDLCASYDTASAIYSDLWAIKACSSRSFLPWSENPATYKFPQHLHAVVDSVTGEVNADQLEKSLEAMRPNANL